MRSHLICFGFCFVFLSSFCQQKGDDCIDVNFNQHQIEEANNKITISAPGTNLIEDRFGNKESALQIHGVRSSYLNLGTSALLKTTHISISLWVKVSFKNYFGKGYESNPIIVVRNSEGEDFNLAYAMSYHYKSDRFSGGCSTDSLHATNIFAKEEAVLNKWCHLALTIDDDFACFYSDGVLQNKLKKGFQSKYNMLDSVLIGHSGSEKNQRYLTAIVDDIKIYNRVLGEDEIMTLYREEDPNTYKNIVYSILKILGIVVFIGIVIVLMRYRHKQQLKKQKERLELENKINELEIKVIKAQMNPHFISNCLAAIQELIYKNDITKAGQYIAKFSYFLRQVLNYSDKNYISVAEEIAIIKLNVELEQLRFKNEFEFTLSVDEHVEIENEWIPALITQPFIENAIWHGLLPLKNLRPPLLHVTIAQKGNFLLIEIEDNGVGRQAFDPKENSKGTKLVEDKIDALNRLSNNLHHKIEVIDLKNENAVSMGTKVIILVDNNN
jgi:hypothetical protein